MKDGGIAENSPPLPSPRGPYSLFVSWNNMVFVSGLLAVKGDGHEVRGDVREEAMVVLRNLEAALREAGSGLDRLLMVYVYLQDIGELPAFNEVYEEMIPRPFPARCVAGVDLPGGFRVELSAIANLYGDTVTPQDRDNAVPGPREEPDPCR